MKTYLIALLALFSYAAQAAVIPSGDSISVGGRVFQLPNAKLKTLICGSATTPNVFGTCRLLNGTSGYQVPGGKTFTMLAVQCSSESSQDTFDFSYWDNDTGLASSTAPVNGVNMGQPTTINSSVVPASTQQALFEINLGTGFVVPSNKYPGMAGGGGGVFTCRVYGTEQ